MSFAPLCQNEASCETTHVEIWEFPLLVHFHVNQTNFHKNGFVREQFLRHLPRYAREIWKRSFTSTVKGLPSTHPSRKRSFAKTIFKLAWRHLKTPALPFNVDGKHFEYRPFQKRWRHHNHVILVSEFSPATNPTCNGRLFLRFQIPPGALWTGNICCIFRVKPPFTIFFVVV